MKKETSCLNRVYLSLQEKLICDIHVVIRAKGTVCPAYSKMRINTIYAMTLVFFLSPLCLAWPWSVDLSNTSSANQAEIETIVAQKLAPWQSKIEWSLTTHERRIVRVKEDMEAMRHDVESVRDVQKACLHRLDQWIATFDRLSRQSSAHWDEWQKAREQMDAAVTRLMEGQDRQANGLSALQTELRSVQASESGLRQLIAAQQANLSNLEDRVNQGHALFSDLIDKLDSQAQAMKEQGRRSDDRLHASVVFQSFLWGAWVVSLFGIAVYLYRSRLQRQKNAKLVQDEINLVNQRLLDFCEVTQKKMMASKGETDHALAVKLADEVTRMEKNLFRMDPAIKGYKQLTAAIRRIRNNFAANGYELVEMQGKPYHEGMLADVTFIADDTLEPGQRLITSVTKPQINHRGVLIQKASVTVSQHI